jgi:hypothetical protein
MHHFIAVASFLERCTTTRISLGAFLKCAFSTSSTDMQRVADTTPSPCSLVERRCVITRYAHSFMPRSRASIIRGCDFRYSSLQCRSLGRSRESATGLSLDGDRT